jgi:hypothetical protein
MCGLERPSPASDFRKQISRLQFQIILVNPCHFKTSILDTKQKWCAVHTLPASHSGQCGTHPDHTKRNILLAYTFRVKSFTEKQRQVMHRTPIGSVHTAKLSIRRKYPLLAGTPAQLVFCVRNRKANFARKILAWPFGQSSNMATHADSKPGRA